MLLAARLRQDSSVPPPARQRALLTSIHAHIEAELRDPGLTPASIAAAHHISVRYLHKLFEPEGRSVAALIDPALAARPVAATAARWGFVSVPHFHRLFRDAYGLPPAEFRAVHADLAKG